MKHAINELKMVLEIAKNNEPIQRASGEMEQADYNAERITGIESALELLEGVEQWNNLTLVGSDSMKERSAAMGRTSANITEWHNDPEVAAVIEHGIGKDHDQALQEEYEGTILDPVTLERRPMTQDEIGQIYADAAGVPVVDEKGCVVYDPAVNETSRQEWLVAQGRSESSSWSSSDEEKYTAPTVAEVEAGVPVGGRVAVPYNPEYQDYASKEYGASAEQIRACSERNQSEAILDIESGRAERIDDDLGELDPSKACGFGEEGCSSCQ